MLPAIHGELSAILTSNITMDPGPSTSPDRRDLIHNAVLFLTDPKVQSSSLASRITFLESKGLNEQEVNEALRLAEAQRGGGGGGSATWAYAGPPEAPRRDWRDLFVSSLSGFRDELQIMAVISGGVVYGLGALARVGSSSTFQVVSL